MSEKSKYIKPIQGLRAIACLGIFLCHCRIIDGGAWGVSVFIILSGFVLTISYIDKSLPCSIFQSIKFAIKKISKLYPLHFILIVLGLILNLFINNDLVFLLKSFVYDILLMQTWRSIQCIYFSPLNGISWYLSDTLFFYFMFPFLLSIVKKIKNYKTVILNIIITFFFQLAISFFAKEYHSDYVYYITYINPIFRLGDFFIGCNLATLFLLSKHEVTTIKTHFTVISTFVIIIIYNFLNIPLWLKNNLLFTFINCCLIYVVACDNNYLSKILNSNTLVYLGNISGYFFLIHMFIIKLNLPFNKYIKTFIYFIITISFCELYKKIYLKSKQLIKSRTIQS